MIHAQILSGMETIKDKLSNLQPIQLTEMEVNILISKLTLFIQATSNF